MEYSTPDPLVLSYLAGVIDSDGSIGIKRSTYHMRVRGDATVPIFSETIHCKQVQPEAVTLLKQTFGGNLRLETPSATRGKPLYAWMVHSAMAGRALVLLRPYLRIKARQADNGIALRALLSEGRRWPVPAIIEGEELITATQFAERVRTTPESVLQACRLGSVPNVRVGRSRMMPVSFAPHYRKRLARSGGPPRTDEMNERMEALYQRAKELNKVGI